MKVIDKLKDFFFGTDKAVAHPGDNTFQSGAILAFEEFYVNLAINMIAGAIGKCEFRTFKAGKPYKAEEYYLWNYEPNANQNSTQFILVNKQVSQLATWSALGSKITEELDGAIGRIDLTLCKLTAFMAISKDMLDAGPQWMDAYVRETLAEASAAGLEKAIITGTGKDQPIGMDRDVSDDASVVGGVYPQKETVAVTDLSPVSFGGLLAKLAKDRNGEARAVNHVILVVNPIDYFLKVFPATTVRATDGTYNRDVLPFPTTVIQSAAVASNRAILGIPEQYFLGVGAGGEKGKIEADDSVRFLDDERVYKTKLYANGRPMDDNSFLHLDVTNLKPTNYVVDVNEVKEIKGVVKTKEQTA